MKKIILMVIGLLMLSFPAYGFTSFYIGGSISNGYCYPRYNITLPMYYSIGVVNRYMTGYHGCYDHYRHHRYYRHHRDYRYYRHHRHW